MSNNDWPRLSYQARGLLCKKSKTMSFFRKRVVAALTRVSLSEVVVADSNPHSMLASHTKRQTEHL